MAETLKKALPNWSDKTLEKIQHLLADSGFSGRISKADTNVLAGSERVSTNELMLGLLPLARRYSRVPISNYHVGVVARGVSGDLYFGANIELPGHSLGLAVHGEQFALSNAYMHGEQGIAAVALTAAPCGHCRQFMNEFSPKGDLEILITGSAPVKLSSLLPMAFGPKDLGFQEGAVPVREVVLARPEGADALTLAAWDAAKRSYAPYTKAHSGIAIGTQAGRIFRGVYIENVAFNPSLSPLQTALAALIVAGETYSSISEVVLVEIEDGVISQQTATEASLAGVAAAVPVKRVTTKAA